MLSLKYSLYAPEGTYKAHRGKHRHFQDGDRCNNTVQTVYLW